MDTREFRINMFGSFSVELNEKKIDDSGNRMRKIWLLIAYLFYHKNRSVSQQELIDILWEEGEEKDNPANALRTTFFRARSLLDKLEYSAGHDLIVRKDGGYRINPDLNISIDVLEFEELHKKGIEADDGDERLELYLKALELYKGDFLVKLSYEQWVRAISVHYHEIYVNLVLETSTLLKANQRFKESAEICRAALRVEPYSEELYADLMQDLIELKNKKEAVSVYDKMSKLFLDDFGVMPSEEIRKLYHEALKSSNENTVLMQEMQEELREKDAPEGALICDYDFFKVLHYSTARLIERSGAAVHICLLTITSKNDKEISRRSLDLAADNLQEHIRTNLRRGDAASKCSMSQFVLMLHFANYENSCMVCERIIKAFNRKYPHSPVKIEYTVQGVQAQI